MEPISDLKVNRVRKKTAQPALNYLTIFKLKKTFYERLNSKKISNIVYTIRRLGSTAYSFLNSCISKKFYAKVFFGFFLRSYGSAEKDNRVFFVCLLITFPGVF